MIFIYLFFFFTLATAALCKVFLPPVKSQKKTHTKQKRGLSYFRNKSFIFNSLSFFFFTFFFPINFLLFFFLQRELQFLTMFRPQLLQIFVGHFTGEHWYLKIGARIILKFMCSVRTFVIPELLKCSEITFSYKSGSIQMEMQVFLKLETFSSFLVKGEETVC